MTDRVLVIAVEASSPHWSDPPDKVRVFVNGSPYLECYSWEDFLDADLVFGFTDAYIVRVVPGVSATAALGDAMVTVGTCGIWHHLLIRAGSATVALTASSNALEVSSVEKPIQMVTPAHLEPSVMEWIAGSNDMWLSNEVAAKVGAHNSWSRVVAAGMVARLAEPSNAEEARAWVRDFAAGKVYDRLSAPLRWARRLDSHEIRTVVELALAEVEALHSEVEAIVSAVDSDAASWKSIWRDICSRRDDVECVLVLLDESGQSARLRSALEVLDREGDLARLSVLAETEIADERMWRASRKSPGSWWGALPTGN